MTRHVKSTHSLCRTVNATAVLYTIQKKEQRHRSSTEKHDKQAFQDHRNKIPSDEVNTARMKNGRKFGGPKKKWTAPQFYSMLRTCNEYGRSPAQINFWTLRKKKFIKYQKLLKNIGKTCKNWKIDDSVRFQDLLRRVREVQALRRSYIIYIKYYVNLERLYESFHAGGKPSTWFPPEGLVELAAIIFWIFLNF